MELSTFLLIMLIWGIPILLGWALGSTQSSLEGLVGGLIGAMFSWLGLLILVLMHKASGTSTLRVRMIRDDPTVGPEPRAPEPTALEAELTKLQRLRDLGFMRNEEFEKRRNELLKKL